MDVPRAEKEARRDVIFIIALMRAKMDDGWGGVINVSCSSVAAPLSPLRALLISPLFVPRRPIFPFF